MIAAFPCSANISGRLVAAAAAASHRAAMALAMLAMSFADTGHAAGPRPILQVMTVEKIETAAALRDETVVATVDASEVVLWDAARWVVLDRIDLPPPAPLHTGEALVAVARPDQEQLVLWQKQVRRSGAGSGNPVCRLLTLDAAARAWAAPQQLPDCRQPPELPQAGEGVWRWWKSFGGLTVTGREPRIVKHADGTTSMSGPARMALGTRPRLPVTGAFVSTDGALVASLVRRLPKIQAVYPGPEAEPAARKTPGSDCDLGTDLKLWNAATGDLLPDIVMNGRYGYLRWIGGERLLALPAARVPGCSERQVPALVIDAVSGEVSARIPARAGMTPLGTGEMVALVAGSAARPGGLLLHSLAGAWRPLPLVGAAARQPLAVGAAFGGRALAVAGRDGDSLVLDLHRRLPDGRFGPPVRLWRAATTDDVADPVVRFSQDDANVMLATRGPAGQSLRAWRAADGLALAKAVLPDTQTLGYLAGDADVMIPGDGLSAQTRVLSTADGRTLATLPHARIIAATMLSAGLLWTIDGNDVIRLFDRRDFGLRLTIHRLPGQFEGQRPTILMVAPDGRYDTNEDADTAPFRWLVDNEPWTSLPASTFMRDYFTPGLYDKLVRCTAARTCNRVLPPVADVSNLNRVLPTLKIEMEQRGHTAEVVITDTSPPGAGVHDIRVLRDGQLVARFPGGDAPPDIAGWRAQTNALAGGQRRWRTNLGLPSGRSRVELAAYAFNSDRVKGETNLDSFEIAPIPARPKRAYVIAVGADDYPLLPGRNLNFAAADAEATARMLGDIVGFDVVPVVLVSRGDRDFARMKVLEAVLRRLGGRRRVSSAGEDLDHRLMELAQIDSRTLAKATPDDAVILSFAGHGWVDGEGHFYFLGSDAAPGPDGAPDPATMLGADRLAGLLQSIEAGTMAMVIDACHSAASVPAGFKPGPLGESGLAQLAYDKRVRVLAATQADDVAIEDSEHGHGLLTSVLLDARRTVVGANGRLALEALLRATVQRLPAVARRRAADRAARASAFEAAHPPLLTVNAAPAPLPRIQQPAMFDFDPRPDVVVLPPVGR